MPQHLSDFNEGRAVAKHLTRQSVTKLMGPLSCGLHAGTRKCALYDGADTPRMQKAAQWCCCSHEHTSGRHLRAPFTNIRCDGFSHVRGQRQLARIAPLPMNGYAAAFPVDVIESQQTDLTGAQAQTCEE
ncbi:MAG: hypothetical protein ABSG79_26170 [Bryobacteraceae bacterium]